MDDVIIYVYLMVKELYQKTDTVDCKLRCITDGYLSSDLIVPRL